MRAQEYAMRQINLSLKLPGDLSRFRMPKALHRRLHSLLDRQDNGERLSAQERAEAEALVDLAELFTLLRLRSTNTVT